MSTAITWTLCRQYVLFSTYPNDAEVNVSYLVIKIVASASMFTQIVYIYFIACEVSFNLVFYEHASQYAYVWTNSCKF